MDCLLTSVLFNEITCCEDQSVVNSNHHNTCDWCSKRKIPSLLCAVQGRPSAVLSEAPAFIASQCNIFIANLSKASSVRADSTRMTGRCVWKHNLVGLGLFPVQKTWHHHRNTSCFGMQDQRSTFRKMAQKHTHSTTSLAKLLPSWPGLHYFPKWRRNWGNPSVRLPWSGQLL